MPKDMPKDLGFSLSSGNSAGGVELGEVERGGRAEKAGLRKRDVVQEVNGVRSQSRADFHHLQGARGRHGGTAECARR